jgi:arylsulfatase A-like enzyme
MSGLLLMWNLGALVFLSLRLVQRLPASWDVWQRATGMMVFVGAIPPITLIVISMLAPVNAYTTALAVFVLLVGERWVPGTRPTREQVQPPTLAETVGLTMLGGTLGHWAFRTAWHGTRFGWDDMTYHAVSPAWWTRTESLAVAPYTYQAYFPFNAELVALWLMLPFKDDAQVALGVFLWGAMATVALVALAKGMGQSPPVAMGMASLFLLGDHIWPLQHTFVAADIAGAAWAMAALALVNAGDGSHREQLAAAAMSGLAIGVGMGTRVFNVPIFIVLVAYWMWVLFKARAGTSRWATTLAVFGCTAVAGCVYWYARNLLLTGNPLFPAEFALFDGPFDAAAQFDTSMRPFMAEGWRSAAFWMEVLAKRWDWPYYLGVLSCLGWLAALVAPFVRRAQPKQRDLVMLVGLVVAVTVVSFPMAPFSGTGNRPGEQLHAFGRYLALPFGLGLAMMGLWIPRTWHKAVVAPLSLLVYTTASHQAFMLPEIAVFGLAVGVVAASLRFSTVQRVAQSRWAVVGALTVMVAIPVLLQPIKKARTDDNVFNMRVGQKGSLRRTPKRNRAVIKRDQRQTLELLETLPRGSKIGAYSHLPSDNRHYYQFFGRSFQHDVTLLESDGRQLGPLHTRWRGEDPNWWTRFKGPGDVDPATFVGNLHDSGLDYVIVSRCQGDFPWPEQAEMIRNAGVFERIHADDCYQIWKTNSLLDDPMARQSIPAETALPVMPARNKKPDIVLVSIDSLRASALSAYGNPLPTSPFLDRLAKKGSRFTQMRSVSSWTLPSHTSLFTGQSPFRHSVVEDDVMVNPATPWLAELLSDAGYETGGFVANHFVSKKYGFERGFTEFEDFGFDDEAVALAGRVPANDVVDAAIAWASTVRRRDPMLMFLHVQDVHHEYDPPPPYDTLFDRAPVSSDVSYRTYKYFQEQPLEAAQVEHQQAQYAESVRYVDEQLKRVDTHLRALGRNPIWVVTSDHGEELGERGAWGHGYTLFAEQLLVPLIVSGPGVPRRKIVDNEVGTADISPMVASWVGVGDALDSDGIDLNLLLDDIAIPPRDAWAETSLSYSNRVSLTHDRVRLEWPMGVEEPPQLFDVSKDLFEADNIATRNPRLVKELQARVVEHLEKPWVAEVAGLVTVRRGIVVDSGRTRMKVAAGQRFAIRPSIASFAFKPDGSETFRQGPWRAVAQQTPEDGDPVTYLGRERLPVAVTDDEFLREALEALGVPR